MTIEEKILQIKKAKNEGKEVPRFSTEKPQGPVVICSSFSIISTKEDGWSFCSFNNTEDFCASDLQFYLEEWSHNGTLTDRGFAKKLCCIENNQLNRNDQSCDIATKSTATNVALFLP